MSKVIKVNVSTGWANGDHNDEWDLPDNWEDYSEKEKERFLNDCALEYLHECCECSARVDDSDE